MSSVQSETFAKFVNVQGDTAYDFMVLRRLPLAEQVGGIWDLKGYIDDRNLGVYRGLGDLLGMIERHPAFRNETFETLSCLNGDLRLMTAGFVLTFGAIYGLYNLDLGFDDENIELLGNHVNRALKENNHSQHRDLTKNMMALHTNAHVLVKNEGHVVWERNPRQRAK